MLTLLFIVLMIGIFGKLLAFGLRATWGIAKLILTIVFLPLILAVMVIGGLIHFALPLLIVIGIIALVSQARTAV